MVDLAELIENWAALLEAKVDFAYGEDEIYMEEYLDCVKETYDKEIPVYEFETLEKEGKNNGYSIIALFVTDIINEGSYIYYSEKSKDILSKAFDVEDMTEGYYLPGVISRKKQIIPNILKIIDNK